MLTVTLFIIFISLIAFIVNWAHKKNKFWEERNVKHRKPVLFFGNSLPVVRNKKHVMEILDDLCKTYPNEPMLGHYDYCLPWLIIQDADWAEKILVKDFVHFTDRMIAKVDEKNPFDDQLAVMSGKRWRAFRYKLSPIFTTGKLKSMFPAMIGCGDNLINYLSSKKQHIALDLKEVMVSFSMDIVGSTVFGIEPNVLGNPDSEFSRMGKHVFISGFAFVIKLLLLTACPLFKKITVASIHNKKAVDYFSKILKGTFKYRSENNIQRNDFVQLLFQFKEKGQIELQNWDKSDDYLKIEESGNIDSYEITENVIMSQAFSFLTTGLEAIGNSQIFVVYELSRHPEIQEKVRQEILEQVKIHGSLNYDSLKGMVYFEKAIKETLRLHAPPQLIRICTKDYTFPNGYTIKKGEALQIVVRRIHTNPEYYLEPEVFKPERFDVPMRPGTYLPFGEGPRICIAMRFALLQMKFGVARLLMKYRIKLNPHTKAPLRYKPQSLLLRTTETLLFDLEDI